VRLACGTQGQADQVQRQCNLPHSSDIPDTMTVCRSNASASIQAMPPTIAHCPCHPPCVMGTASTTFSGRLLGVSARYTELPAGGNQTRQGNEESAEAGERSNTRACHAPVPPCLPLAFLLPISTSLFCQRRLSRQPSLPATIGCHPPRKTRPKPWRKEGGGSTGSPVSASKPTMVAAPPNSTALSKAPVGVKALAGSLEPAASGGGGGGGGGGGWR
jgi:hypothetical protein